MANIYVGIRERGSTEVANIIALTADGYTAVQLPMTVEGMEGIAVSPDGQNLFVWDSKGNVLRWKQPWPAGGGEVLATFDKDDINIIDQCLADDTW
jgi:sugar lactone lactonase YvrE